MIPDKPPSRGFFRPPGKQIWSQEEAITERRLDDEFWSYHEIYSSKKWTEDRTSATDQPVGAGKYKL